MSYTGDCKSTMGLPMMDRTVSETESLNDVVISSSEKPSVKVLHVDDDVAVLKITKQCLELEGDLLVDEALSVDEALAKLEGEEYDIIVSDYQMPRKDGLELLEKIRKDGNSIPFIMFTGKGREEVAIQALNLGADQYLNKTGEAEAVFTELVHSIRKLVNTRRAEQRLRDSEEKLKALFTSSPEAITVFDLDGRVSDLNQAAMKLHGFSSKEEIVGKSSFDFVAQRDRGKAVELFRNTLRQGLARNAKITLLKKDGGEFLAEISGNVVYDSKAEATSVATVIKDITERRRTEEELTRSEEKFRTLFEGANDAFVYLDLTGRIIDVNQKAAELAGLRKEEITGRFFAKMGLVSVKDIPMLLNRLKSHLEGKPSDSYELTLNRKDGEKKVVEISASLISENDANRGVLVGIRDVTDRRKIEEAILESEEKYRNMVELAPDIMVTCDRRGVIASFNTAGERISGYNKDEVVGKPFTKIGHIKLTDVPKYMKIFNSMIRKKNTGTFTLTMYHKDGRPRKVEIRACPLIHRGKVTGAQAIMRDITDRDKIEKALVESENKFKSIVENTQDLVMLTQPDGTISYLSPACSRVLGYEPEDLVGKQPWIIHPEDLEMVKKTHLKALKGGCGSDLEYRILTKSGQTKWIMHSWSSIMEGRQVKFIVSVVKDITERKAREQSMQEDRQKFEGLFSGNPEASVYMSRDFRILDINSRFEELFGYSLSEIRNKHINSVIVPIERMNEAEALDKEAVRGYVYHDTLRQRKDGAHIPVSVSAAPIEANGSTIGCIGIYKDISQQKEAEKKLAATNEKLRVVGSLSRHDVRNKLSTITGNVFLAERKIPESDPVRENLKDIKDACSQIVRILDFSKDYEMLGVEEPSYLKVGEMFEKSASLFSAIDEIKTINECEELRILADSLLGQVFYNLIDNSVKYGQKITQIRLSYSVNAENQLALFYEDDGVGIAESDRSRLFGEGCGQGTGYGLYLIRKIVEAYGWMVTEESKQDEGVRFVFTVPKTNRQGKLNYWL